MHSFLEIPKIALESIVHRALEEDIPSGDMTSDACIDPDSISTAKARARHPLIACGSSVAAAVFAAIDPNLRFEALVPDGTPMQAGDVLWQVVGGSRSILLGERVALNFVQRMCGIATMTRRYVDAVPAGCSTRIADTRKTTPGLRALERYAVRVGGGHNHRDNLGSAILIKDNHIAACRSITKALERAKAFSPHTSHVECEVDTLEQLKEAIAAGADIVLLDNMDTTQIIKAVEIAKGKVIIEASGGITLQRIPELARAGVDVISVGALTHSVAASDIGLDM